MGIIIKPIVTEKLTEQGDKLNRYGFIVDRKANKLQIKSAVEQMYNVTVADVNTVNYHGKRKSRYTKAGLLRGRMNHFKKAYITLTADSTKADTLSADPNQKFIFILVYEPDSVDQNQLLFEMARYNFTNFLVRNFDIQIDEDNGLPRMIISGFLSFDEAMQYARQLYDSNQMKDKLTDEEFGVIRAIQDRKRKSDVVVEVPLRRVGLAYGGQKRPEKLLRGGLAGRASETDDLRPKGMPPRTGLRL